MQKLIGTFICIMLLPCAVFASGARESSAGTEETMVLTWLDKAEIEDTWMNAFM